MDWYTIAPGLFLSIPVYTWLFSTCSRVGLASNPIKRDSIHSSSLCSSGLPNWIMHCKCHKCLGRRQSCTGVSLSGQRWIELCWGNTSPSDIRWHLLECTWRHGNRQSDAKHFFPKLFTCYHRHKSISTHTHTQTERKSWCKMEGWYVSMQKDMECHSIGV